MAIISKIFKEFENSRFSRTQLVMGFCVGNGIIFGTAIGEASDSVGVGVVIGIILGVIIGNLLDSEQKSQKIE
ncbi:MAG: hypothetical protein IH901_01085 [Proteobacteria bacterium]|nr:hypothetical protein [Pseudomonadota bacterium]